MVCESQEELTRYVSASDLRPVLCARSDNQKEENTVVISAGTNISEVPHISSTNCNIPPTQENVENLLCSNSSCRETDNNDSGACCFCGNDQCNKQGYLSHRALINMVVFSLSRVEGGGTTVSKNGSPHIRSPGRITYCGEPGLSKHTILPH